MRHVSWCSTTAASWKWARSKNCKSWAAVLHSSPRHSSRRSTRRRECCYAACDSGEDRKIAVTKVRGDANSKEGRDIDCGRSTDADGKGAFGGPASPPCETAYGDTTEQPGAGAEQRCRFKDVMNVFQCDKGGAIRKNFLFRPFDVGHPY